MKSAVLIPSYCPNEAILSLAKGLLWQDFTSILIVDDGSGPAYAPIFQELQQLGCYVIAHETNRGKGAALKTGFGELIRCIPDLDIIVTADGDGQHAPEDIYKIASSLRLYPDTLILGTRDFSCAHVPVKSRLGNRFSSLYFRWNTGVACSDTQTGLRGIPACLFALALDTPGARYEYEMAFLMAAVKQKHPIAFIPIQTIYENNNAGSHFRPVADAMLIYQTPLKFMCASLFGAAIDLSLFAALSTVPVHNVWFKVFFATVMARVASGGVNFYLNRVWSFGSKQPVGTQAVKYATLFVSQMLMSWTLVSALSFLPIYLTLIKIFVDCALFAVSYLVQQNWVFADHSSHNNRISI